MKAFLKIYCWLLQLYPVSFRARFGDEMEGVFAALLKEKSQQGDGACFGAFCKEAASLPIVAAGQHLKGKGITMPGEGANIAPLSWRKVFLAILPGLIWIFLVVNPLGLTMWPVGRINSWLVMLGIGGLVPTVVGWLWEKRIPVWGLLGIGLSIGVVCMNFSYYSEYVLLASEAILLIAMIWLTWHRRGGMKLAWLIILSVFGVGSVFGILTTICSGNFRDGFAMSLIAQAFFEARGFVGLFELALFAVLIGLPFARRFGTAAVLVMLGVLSIQLMIPLADGEEWLEPILETSFTLLMMVLLPLLVFRADSLTTRLRGVLLPFLVVLVGGLLNSVVFLSSPLRRLILLPIIAIEVLLGLALAFILYDQIARLQSDPMRRLKIRIAWD